MLKFYFIVGFMLYRLPVTTGVKTTATTGKDDAATDDTGVSKVEVNRVVIDRYNPRNRPDEGLKSGLDTIEIEQTLKKTEATTMPMIKFETSSNPLVWNSGEFIFIFLAKTRQDGDNDPEIKELKQFFSDSNIGQEVQASGSGNILLKQYERAL